MTNNNAQHKLNGGTPHTLEQRVAAALTDAGIGASALAELVVETEKGIADAEVIAQRLEQVALDPVCSPDAAEAQATADRAVLICKRLRHVLPRLQERHQQVLVKERAARWNAAADQVQSERDAIASMTAETYPILINQLIDVFQRVKAMDQQIDKINSAAPNSVGRRIPLIGHQSVLTNSKLLNLAGQSIWPPPTPPILPQDVMPVLPPVPRDWHQALLDRDREQRAEAQRVALYYQRQAQQREEREVAERAARARNGAAP